MKLTKKRLYLIGGFLTFVAVIPLTFKLAQVDDAITMKVLEFVGSGFGLTLGGYLLGAGMNKKDNQPPNG